MCSVDDSAALPLGRDRSTKGDVNCVKCGERAMIAMRAPDRQCRACFLYQCRHKFRATLGKARLIRQGDAVLVAYSGGLSSSALMSIIAASLNESELRRLRFVPSICYIDESAVYGWTEGERQEALQLVTSAMESTSFPYCCLPLEVVFADEEKMVSYIRGCLVSAGAGTECVSAVDKSSSDNCLGGQQKAVADTANFEMTWQRERDQLQRCMTSCNSLTAKEDLLRSLRTQLLAEVAVNNSFPWVMTGENCTRLAVRLLSDIVQGRGVSLQNATGFTDKRRENVVFVRPLREFSSKEVAIYSSLHRLTPLGLPTLSTKTEENASLDRQTESFVMALQANFPSTVSTVFRTGDKLAAEKVVSSEFRCVICSSTAAHLHSDSILKSVTAAGHLFGDKQELSLDALSLCSPSVSTPTCSNTDASGVSDTCGGACSCKSNVPVHNRTADLLNHVCYGCRLLLRDMGNNVDQLPVWAKEKAAQSQQRAKMRDEIKDFLLEDD